jgi:hypothetical protein
MIIELALKMKLKSCPGRGISAISAGVLLITAVGPAFACVFDADCKMGSQCVKPRGSIYGVCAGEQSPGNGNDGTVGNACSFDTDCGKSNKCVKSTGSLYGVCMRDRSTR